MMDLKPYQDPRIEKLQRDVRLLKWITLGCIATALGTFCFASLTPRNGDFRGVTLRAGRVVLEDAGIRGEWKPEGLWIYDGQGNVRLRLAIFEEDRDGGFASFVLCNAKQKQMAGIAAFNQGGWFQLHDEEERVRAEMHTTAGPYFGLFDKDHVAVFHEPRIK